MIKQEFDNLPILTLEISPYFSLNLPKTRGSWKDTDLQTSPKNIKTIYFTLHDISLDSSSKTKY